jgi:hypothetical protein
MVRVIVVISAATIFVLCPEAAQDQKFYRACTTAGRHLWLSLEALETRVEAQGYKIQKGRFTSTCATFEVLSATGARIELLVDPTNGEIVGKI